MSERYTRLFALEENLYSEGSPVIISAGALLKDNQSGAILVQLKVKNISRRRLRAAIVRIFSYDSFGKPTGTEEKEYLDLMVVRGEEFGQKVLIPVSNAAARSFTATVTCVGFTDGTVWNYADEEQSVLPNPILLAKELKDSELLKQYRLKYGANAQVLPEEYKDIWYCTCGAINHACEEVCYLCGQKKADVFPLNIEALEKEKCARLYIEKEKAAEEEAERKKAAATRLNRIKRIARAVAPILCVCIVFVIVLTQVILPQRRNTDTRDVGGNDPSCAISEETGKEIADGEQNKPHQEEKNLAEVEAGDIVSFGLYEQDNAESNGKEKIKWIVLTKEENRLLVISRYALDCQPYNARYVDTTWEVCTLRRWLNEEFFQMAFSDSEKEKISTVTVAADPNPDYSTDPGEETSDKVFLLSIKEVNEYFHSDEDRLCEATDYAEENGGLTSDGYTKNGEATCWWWLRSPGFFQNSAARVHYDGSIYCSGRGVGDTGGCVRPAMWIDIEA